MLNLAFRTLVRHPNPLPTLSPLAALHSSNNCSRWYKHFYRLKPTPVPIKEELTFPQDWEHKPYQPRAPDAISDSVKMLSEFESLTPIAQTVFSTQFLSKEQELEAQINNKLMELGYHPTDDCVGATVIRMTLQIRYKKWMLHSQPRNGVLYRATRALVHARWRKLRQLRATNLPEFNRLCQALEITGYRHIDPYEFPTTDPVVQRKKETRLECYRARLLKLANLKLKISNTESQFYRRKQEQLEQLLDQLATLETDDDQSEEARRERAKQRLKRLFDETIEQRQNEALRDFRNDQFAWYAKEQQIREQYLAKQAEKAEKQLRKKR